MLQDLTREFAEGRAPAGIAGSTCSGTRSGEPQGRSEEGACQAEDVLV